LEISKKMGPGAVTENCPAPQKTHFQSCCHSGLPHMTGDSQPVSPPLTGLFAKPGFSCTGSFRFFKLITVPGGSPVFERACPPISQTADSSALSCWRLRTEINQF
jgi:hypothetical protein